VAPGLQFDRVPQNKGIKGLPDSIFRWHSLLPLLGLVTLVSGREMCELRFGFHLALRISVNPEWQHTAPLKEDMVLKIPKRSNTQGQEGALTFMVV
jgi:hypothetical protein